MEAVDDKNLTEFVGVKITRETREAIERRCTGKVSKSKFIRKVVEDYLNREETLGFSHNKRWYDMFFDKMNKGHLVMFVMLTDFLPAKYDQIVEKLGRAAYEVDEFFKENSRFYRIDSEGRYVFVGDGRTAFPMMRVNGVEAELKYDLSVLAEIPQAGAEIPQALAGKIQEGAANVL